jgi:alpha-amylase
MSTKPSSVMFGRGIYDNAFDAFTNYMNILGDFISRVNSLYPEEIDNEELNSLLTTIRNQGEEIAIREKEIIRLQTKIEKMEQERVKDSGEKTAKKKTKKATTTKK